jgi:hypothetical protein
MKFEEVLEGMREGKKYRLPHWKEPHRSIRMTDETVVDSKGDVTWCHASMEQILSTKWEEVIEKEWTEERVTKYIGYVLYEEGEVIIDNLYDNPSTAEEYRYAPYMIRWEPVVCIRKVLS